MARYSAVFVFSDRKSPSRAGTPTAGRKLNLLPEEPIENFWDALWLGIQLFLCFTIESRKVVQADLLLVGNLICYGDCVGVASGDWGGAPLWTLSCGLCLASVSPSPVAVFLCGLLWTLVGNGIAFFTVQTVSEYEVTRPTLAH